MEGPIVFNVPHVTDLWHNAFCKAARLGENDGLVKTLQPDLWFGVVVWLGHDDQIRKRLETL